MTEHEQQCRKYISERKSTYEFRSIRYREVYNRLMELGLAKWDRVTDLGAGRCDFDRFLREQGWEGIYIPVDGGIDGTDLNTYWPKNSEFFVCIEVLEHLHVPRRLLNLMRYYANKGAVATTPNPATTDVLGMDKTHVTPIRLEEFREQGWGAYATSLFLNNPEDTIVATFKAACQRMEET